MSQVRRQALFTPAGRGQRFTLVTDPASVPTRGTVLHMPAFAEEMNKSRRMVALGTKALAESGWRVIQVDLRGCGDSEGDLGDATWEIWLDDLDAALRLHRAGPRLCLWGLRAGALFAGPLLQCHPDASLLLWQPVLSGKQHLAQFLRLSTAASILAHGGSAGRKAIEDELASGRSAEVAGYMISPQLARSMEAAVLQLDATQLRQLHWLEVSTGDTPQLTSASRQFVNRLQEAGVDVKAIAVAGYPFWCTQELVEVAGLSSLTAAMLAGGVAGEAVA